jgi:hypothetical protein
MEQSDKFIRKANRKLMMKGLNLLSNVLTVLGLIVVVVGLIIWQVAKANMFVMLIGAGVAIAGVAVSIILEAKQSRRFGTTRPKNALISVYFFDDNFEITIGGAPQTETNKPATDWGIKAKYDKVWLIQQEENMILIYFSNTMAVTSAAWLLKGKFQIGDEEQFIPFVTEKCVNAKKEI